MPDLAAFGAALRSNLTGREGREVVMMHIALGLLNIEVVQRLGVARCAQRRNGQDLCLATGEQSAAVHAGQQAHFHADWPDLQETAAIRAHLLAQDALAHQFLLETVKGQHQRPGLKGLAQCGHQLLLEGDQPAVLRFLGEVLCEQLLHPAAQPGSGGFGDGRIR